jgi:serine protease Do
LTVSMMDPNQTAKLKVFRNGQTLDYTATVSPMPGQKVERADNAATNAAGALEGVAVEDLDAQTARQLGLPGSTSGVVVTEVDPASQAAASGLHQGDVIQSVNRQPVNNAEDFNRAVRKSNGESLLLVNREGHKLFLAV